MPVNVGWLYEKRVIKIHQHGKVTSQELVAAIAQQMSNIAEGIQPVHTFVDARDVEGNPEISISDLKKLVPRLEAGTGWMVVVQPHILYRFLTSWGFQIAGAKYKFVTSQEEGMRFLLEQDPTLLDVIR